MRQTMPGLSQLLKHLRPHDRVLRGVVAGLVLLGGCGPSTPVESRTPLRDANTGTQGGAKAATERAPSPVSAQLRGDETVCRFGTAVRTVADATEYLNRYPGATVDEFMNRELAVHDVLQRGLQRRAPAKKQLRLFALSALGDDFVESGLDRRIAVTGDEIAADLPGSFRLGNFEILLFDSMDDAKSMAETVRTEKEFREIAAKRPGKVKKTGEIFPSSGFFAKYDDVALFNMKPGQVTGLIETGLGLAIARVDSMRELTPEETGDAVRRIREKLVDAKKGELVRDMRRRHRYSRLDPVIARMARKDLADDWTLADDPVIGSVDDIDVTFRNLKHVLPADPKVTQKDITEGDLARYYERAMLNLQYSVAIGLDAEREGYGIRSEARRKELEELNRRYFFSLGVIDRLGKDAAPPTDKVAKAHYDANPDMYRSQEMVRLGVIFTADEAKANEALKEHRGGADFGEVARKYSERKGASGMVAEEVYLLRNHLYVKEYPDLQKLFTPEYRKAGTVSPVLRGPEGFYVFRILEYHPEGQKSFRDVRAGIRKTLWTRAVEKGLAGYYSDLRSRYALEPNADVVERLRSRERKGAHGGSPHGPGGGGAR